MHAIRSFRDVTIEMLRKVTRASIPHDWARVRSEVVNRVQSHALHVIAIRRQEKIS